MAAGLPLNFDREDDKERVRNASDIVRVVGDVVALKAKGREYVGLCPFHDDKKPSMWVSPAKGIFKCFACGAGGDVFTFVQKYHAMDFREALEFLAERAGIELSKPAPRSGPGAASGEYGHESDEEGVGRKDLLRANAAGMEFFRKVLQHPEAGQVGRDIIARRGIAPEMVELFGIGLAPTGWDGLASRLAGMGANLAAYAEAGLLKRRDGGGYYDAFRNRLMFPIQDQFGRVIAFGGRKIAEEDEPKYLNSPESRIFEKAGTLYGLPHAARTIQQRRMAVITEGYTDTIACHQAGLTNAVATLGTALTARHAAVLRRMCDTVVLMFDGDEAGQRAADRAVEVFFAEELDVKICTLAGHTDAKDPDELLKREGGLAVLERAIAAAPDLLSYRYARIRQRLAGAGMSAINRAIEEELARLVQLGLPDLPVLRRTLIIKQIASIAGVSEEVIARSVPSGRGARTMPERPAAAGLAESARAVLRDPRAQALGCLLAEPALWAILRDGDREQLDPMHFGGVMHTLADAMFAVAARRGRCGIQELCAAEPDPDVQALATELATRMEQLGGEADGRAARLGQYLRDCLMSLASAHGGESAATLEELRQKHAAGGGNRRSIPGRMPRGGPRAGPPGGG